MTAPRTTGSPPPTDEQLRMAWRQISRPGWPATMEAALAHPVYGICLRAMARQLNRPAFSQRPAPPPARVLPTPPPPPAGVAPRPRMQQEPLFDRKRAAANDKDD